MACDLLTASLTLRERSFLQCLCDSSCSRMGELVRRWALPAHCRRRAFRSSTVVLPRQASARRLVSGYLTSLAPSPSNPTRIYKRHSREQEIHLDLFVSSSIAVLIHPHPQHASLSTLFDQETTIARLSTHSVKKFSCVSVFLSLSFTYPPHSPQLSRSLATFVLAI